MVFLDATILLELILPGRAKLDETAALLAQLTESTAISVLTIHVVMHLGRKHGVPDDILHDALAPHTMLDLTPDDYQWASQYEQGKDFEDALQLAVALREGCGSIVTLDKPFTQHYRGQAISFVVPA